jgi:hypothetical protein
LEKYKLHSTEKKEKNNIWESLYLLELLVVKKDCRRANRERRLIAREFFWWLTGRKHELVKVVERVGEEMV